MRVAGGLLAGYWRGNDGRLSGGYTGIIGGLFEISNCLPASVAWPWPALPPTV